MKIKTKDPDLALLLDLYGVNPDTLYCVLWTALYDAEKRLDSVKERMVKAEEFNE